MIGPTNANPKNTVLTDNVQTISATKTFSASPTVPDTPANTHSAVNQAYVESTVDGINNLVHKSGSEVIAGTKIMTEYNPFTFKRNNIIDWDNPPESTQYASSLRWLGVDSSNNDVAIGSIRLQRNTDGSTTMFIIVKNSDGTDKIFSFKGDVI